MTTNTTNLSLITYNSTTDGSSLFANYRADQAGVSPTSNMGKIDMFAGIVTASLISLSANKPIILVPSTYISTNYYEATVASITAYTTNMVIALTLDTTNVGTVTLNINSLGTKSLVKINVDGTSSNFTDSELRKNKKYLFTYDGSQWVWIAGTSADQISVSGSNTNLLMISGCGVIVDSEISSSSVIVDDISLYINVKKYGAIGNGVTDDTLAISNAISAIPSTGGILFFPAGTYKTSGGFTISNPTIIEGCGMGGHDGISGATTTITCTSGSSSLFTVSSYVAKFKDLLLLNTSGSSPAPTAGAGITVYRGTSLNKVDFDSVSVSRFYIDIDIQSSDHSVMNNCLLEDPVKYALKIANTVNPDTGDWSITNTTLFNKLYTSDAAIRIESSGGGKITNCKINSSTLEFIKGIDLSPTGQSIILHVLNTSIESVSTGFYANTSGVIWRSIVIMGCEFGLWDVSTTNNAIYMSSDNVDEIQGVVISGNTFFGNSTGADIVLDKISNITITSNIKSGASSPVILATNCKFLRMEDNGNGWILSPTSWTYISASAINIAEAGDMINTGDKLKFTQSGSTIYLPVISVTTSSGSTILFTEGGTSYSVSASTIYSPYYSHTLNPRSFPKSFSYTPSWSASSTNPDIGNGSISGKFSLLGSQCDTYIRIASGSTTNFGSGTYTFGLPIAAAEATLVLAQCSNSAGGYKIGVGRTVAGSKNLTLRADGTVNLWGSASPVTWASGNEITISCVYFI